jgi:hypothetical protein
VNKKAIEADGLSKSLGGASFLEFHGKVLNLSKLVNRWT